jgi:hypothetical protein
MLISRELREGKWQIFSTNGAELVVKRQRPRGSQEIPRSAFFSNSGVSLHAGRGWIIGEISLSTNQWSGGDETQLRITPAYVWRIGQRAELLFGGPLGITSSTERVGAVVKFTFELGGKPD